MQWLDISFLRADTYDQTVIANGLAMAIIFLSFVLVTGLGGMVSLAQATFVTVGGFAAGWALAHDWGFDIPLDHPRRQGQLLLRRGRRPPSSRALVGMLVAWPMTRLGGVALALGTLVDRVRGVARDLPDRLHRQPRGGLEDPLTRRSTSRA